ncbi:MAG TPA: hypothetical protein VMM93_00965 [Vicinamibacterales bacterium]|nr:hypothetical protein [Vicinamibacterales bacterium]
MPEQLTEHERRAIQKTILRIHEQGWGIAFGLLFGLGLLIATLVLVVEGGEPLGPHLGLLGLYFPGYSVSVVGGFIGFVYAFVLGYGVGRVIATVYNRLTAGMR